MAVQYLSLPLNLQFLKQASTRFDDQVQPDEADAYWALLSNEARAALIAVATRIAEERLQQPISRWMMDCSDSYFAGYTSHIVGLCVQLSSLAEAGYTAFAAGYPYSVPVEQHVDWSAVPEDFSYLVPLAREIGRYPFDSVILEFITEATPEQRTSVGRVVKEIDRRGHWNALFAWIGAHHLCDHPEVAAVDFILKSVRSRSGFAVSRLTGAAAT